MSRQEVLDIIRRKLDPASAAILESALADSDRMTVIRDAFLEGRDHDAVMLLRELDPIGIRTLIGISSLDNLYPTQSAQIAIRPQLPFLGTRLLVSQACAAAFVIMEIRVGTRSMLPASGDLAADLFAVDAVPAEVEKLVDDPDNGLVTIKIAQSVESRIGIPIDMPLCMPGQQITLAITNISVTPIQFRGALLGTVQHRD
jgi:hypothetical protein